MPSATHPPKKKLKIKKMLKTMSTIEMVNKF
jgi:hypothetical protein